MPAFVRYIGIDYSGAETPTASLKGLRVYVANGAVPPAEVPPPPSPRKYWTRRGIAEWLVQRLAEDAPTLVGIDHGFSFPLRYLEAHRLPPNWPAFLDDFQRHWPTDEDHTYVDFVRDGAIGNGAARMGNSRWRRLTEEKERSNRFVPMPEHAQDLPLTRPHAMSEPSPISSHAPAVAVGRQTHLDGDPFPSPAAVVDTAPRTDELSM